MTYHKLLRTTGKGLKDEDQGGNSEEYNNQLGMMLLILLFTADAFV